MKPCVGLLIAYLAGQAIAAAPARDGSGLIKRGRMAAANAMAEDIEARDDNVANLNLKFDAATTDGPDYEFQERIHGSPQDLSEFVDKLTLSQLKHILGTSYGKPFRLTFLDEKSGDYLGYLAGYFTKDGGVSFDQQSRVPGGGSLPSIPKQPSLAPTVTTITLSGDQSRDIIEAGKVTDSQLQDILGADYGKPFKLYLTNSDGEHVGLVSGSFNGDGVKFDSSTHIPSTSVLSGSGSGSSGSGSSGSGSSGSGSSGSGSSGQNLASTTVQPPPPTAAPANDNTGSVTIDGASTSQIESTLNGLSYNYILNAVNGKYGPFYITFSSDDGSLQGYIKGTITKSTFSYQWAYTEN